MLRRVALARTGVSEEPSASFIRVTRIGELGTTQAATSNRRTLTRATQRNIPEDTILHSHRRENLKSYITAQMFFLVLHDVLRLHKSYVADTVYLQWASNLVVTDLLCYRKVYSLK
jgi:hypothetical protein